MKTTRRIFFIILLILCHHAVAHDPGSSTAIVNTENNAVNINLSYAREDINSIVLIDTNYNSTISPSEFESARNNLNLFAKSLVQIENNTENSSHSIPTIVSITLIENNGLNILLKFKRFINKKTEIIFSAIDQFPRGHRQYVVVRDKNNEQISQHVLSQNNNKILIDSQKQARLSTFNDYVAIGIEHIWTGFDHLLFLLTLLLPAVMIYRQHYWQAVEKLRPAIIDTLKIVSSFSVAHSITLILSVLQVVSLPMQLVEAAIALSVAIVAINNLFPVFKSRWSLAFIFGLLHGFGFSNALQNLNLQSDSLVVSLLGFNIGVELGQLAVVVLFFPIIAFVRHTTIYRTWGLGAGSFAVTLIAITWLFDRIV